MSMDEYVEYTMHQQLEAKTIQKSQDQKPTETPVTPQQNPVQKMFSQARTGKDISTEPEMPTVKSESQISKMFQKARDNPLYWE